MVENCGAAIVLGGRHDPVFESAKVPGPLFLGM